MAVSTAQTLHPTRNTMHQYLPESDGKPMSETDTHRDQMIDLLDCLQEYFRSDPKVYVTGNIFLYPPREEEERQPISPDIFVVFGIEKKMRRIYDMEKEGKAPDVVIELISKSTRQEDLGTKRYVYAELGVREYYIFDPLKEAFASQLRGFQLEGDEYLPIVGTDRFRSKLLGLDLVVENSRLRLYDVETGERLRIHSEEAEARRQAEIEVARLKQELSRLQEKMS